MKLTTLLCYFLLLTSITQAQEKDKYGRPPLVPGIAELKIGDQVPDILIDKIINNDKRSIRTSDYKDKLLVLDFWERSCMTCIESMPKLDSLQRVFGDRIKLLSVTWEPEDKIVDFFNKNRFLKEHTPPVHRASAVDDRIMRSYFHYESNPHVVWIYKSKVVAITGTEYINDIHIQELLDGKTVNWPLKNDSFDVMNSFMRLNALSEEVMDSQNYSYSVLTGMSNAKEPKVGGIYFRQDSVRNISRLAFFNQNITSIYEMLLSEIKPAVTVADVLKDPTKMAYILSHPSRRVIEVSDLSRFQNINKEDQFIWYRKHLLCYEMEKHGMIDKKTLLKLALKDLNNRLMLLGRLEKRKVKCLVFVKTDKPITDLGQVPIMQLVMDLDLTRKYPPALDETGFFTGGLNMQSYDGTIAGLRKEMQRHGLDLIEAEREIEVMVISDAKQ
jgi:thiol-disulfide isomerase/thioredoxin